MRIVSLSPSFTEILEYLGCRGAAAGITDHCPEIFGARRVGSPKAIRIKEVENLCPDLILADQNENRLEEIRELDRKYGVLSFDVRSLEAVRDAIARLGRITASQEKAGELLNQIRAEEEAGRAAFQGQNKIRAFILLWNQPYVTVNFDTYASRLVEASGGINIFHEEPLREFPIELEDMIDRSPELLLLPASPFPFQKRHIRGFRQYRTFSKIRIELVDGKLFSRFGPRTAQALKILRELMSLTSVRS